MFSNILFGKLHCNQKLMHGEIQRDNKTKILKGKKKIHIQRIIIFLELEADFNFLSKSRKNYESGSKKH